MCVHTYIYIYIYIYTHTYIIIIIIIIIMFITIRFLLLLLIIYYYCAMPHPAAWYRTSTFGDHTNPPILMILLILILILTCISIITYYYFYCLCYLLFGDHTNPHHPHKSDLSQFNKFTLQRTTSVLCVFHKFLHLINPTLYLFNGAWWGWGGFVWSPMFTYKS